ncbi:MAG: YbdK family carboxylate-amine ligase [Bdellovibrionales bacterium]
MLDFKKSEHLTLGTELELQLIDPSTYDLKPSSLKIFEKLNAEHPKIKAEIFQSMIELNTGICQNAHEVNSDFQATVQELTTICNDLGVRLSGGGSHPFALYTDRIIHPSPRFAELIDRNKWIARRLMIFGLHVHIGMKDPETAVQFINALHHYLPILLSLSASSPYWHSDDTGLASSRITFFEAIPTGGHASLYGSWNEFVELYDKLIETESIQSCKDIWWDIRPNPDYGTVEIRICDTPPTLKEAVAIVALIHTLCLWLNQKFKTGVINPPPDWIMRENKWRASRYGLDAHLILDSKPTVKPARALILELLSILQPHAQQMKYEEEFEFIRKILKNGASYERQRLAYQKSNFLGAVVKQTIEEFASNKPDWMIP